MNEPYPYIHLESEIHEKVWGQEEWIVNTEDYCGKILRLKKGYYSSYHYHEKKDETLYLLSGCVHFRLDDTYSILKPGKAIRIEPYMKHSFRGIEDSIILEFSTHHDENDVVRLTQSGNVD